MLSVYMDIDSMFLGIKINKLGLSWAKLSSRCPSPSIASCYVRGVPLNYVKVRLSQVLKGGLVTRAIANGENFHSD